MTSFVATAAPTPARVPWSTSIVGSGRGVLAAGIVIRAPFQRGGLFLSVLALYLQRDAPIDRVP